VYAAVRSPGDAPDGTTELLLDVTDADAVAALSFERLPDRLRDRVYTRALLGG
jgi:hypothetical protein